jgi:hypothetical protein
MQTDKSYSNLYTGGREELERWMDRKTEKIKE